MKYNDNGEYKDIYVKAFDTLPVGTEVDYDGSTVPSGWTQVEYNKIAITPTGADNYPNYGNSYYYKDGNRVHIHIGLQNLTANTQTTIASIPVEYRPLDQFVCSLGIASNILTYSSLNINKSNGNLIVASQNTYALIDLDYWI